MGVFMKRFFIVFAALGILIILNSCKNNPASSTNGPVVNNLIVNPSFENNGQATLAGWDTTFNLAGFSNDTPTGGGKWSAEIITYDQRSLRPFRFGFLNQNVKVMPNIKLTYTLTFWAKLDSSISDEASLKLFQPDTTLINYVTINNSTWTKYSIMDTASSNVIDSISVSFGIGNSYLGVGKVLVDLCSLTAK